MKKLLPTLAFLILFQLSFSQTPFHHYSFALGESANNDSSFDHAIDAQGNIYYIATFGAITTTNYSVDIDPGPGVYSFTGSPSYARPALIKMNSAGQILWGTKLCAGGQDCGAYAVAIDASGSAYVTGSFSGTTPTDFDPGTGTFTIMPNGTLDNLFVTKYDANGNWQWALGFGGNSSNRAYDIKVGALGNVYVCGSIEGTGCDFDPGAGTAVLTPAGSKSGFIAKYTSSGTYSGAFLTGGTFCNWNDLLLDASENIYAIGNFEGANIDMDPGAGSALLSASTSNYNIFVAKYNSSLQYQWAFKLGASAGNSAGGLAFDQSGNIFTTGMFSGTMDFDPGPGNSLVTSGGNNGFISKYSPSGAFLSAITMFGVSDIVPASDAAGNVYVTGTYFYNVDFDPSSGSAIVTNNGGTDDIFVAKYNSSLAYQWAFGIAGSGNESGKAINVDPYKNVTICGYFDSSVMDTDPGSATNNLTNTGSSWDMFFARFSQSPDIGIREITNADHFTVGPNPCDEIFDLYPDHQDTYDVKVYNSLGGIVYAKDNLRGHSKVDLSTQTPGIYFVRSGSATIKLIKQ